MMMEEEAACDCRACTIAHDGEQAAEWAVMFLCSICGNKRCPHATDHRNPCTGSNEPGQQGSAYQ